MPAKPQLALAALALLTAASPLLWADGPPAQPTITGKAAFADYSQESPGTRRKITVADLPAPYATESVDNGPTLVPKPGDAWPKAPAGFKVELYAQGLDEPRLIRFAPNGDLFVADSEVDRKPDTGKIRVFRGVDAKGKPKVVSVYATGLAQPFGISFYPLGPNPKWLYIGNTDAVVRFPYKNGDLKASGPPQKITDLPGGGRLRGGGHCDPP